jgi:hypothetical protein
MQPDRLLLPHRRVHEGSCFRGCCGRDHCRSSSRPRTSRRCWRHRHTCAAGLCRDRAARCMVGQASAAQGRRRSTPSDPRSPPSWVTIPRPPRPSTRSPARSPTRATSSCTRMRFFRNSTPGSSGSSHRAGSRRSSRRLVKSTGAAGELDDCSELSEPGLRLVAPQPRPVQGNDRQHRDLAARGDLTGEDDPRLSEWMSTNLWVVVAAVSDADQLGLILPSWASSIRRSTSGPPGQPGPGAAHWVA